MLGFPVLFFFLMRLSEANKCSNITQAAPVNHTTKCAVNLMNSCSRFPWKAYSLDVFLMNRQHHLSLTRVSADFNFVYHIKTTIHQIDIAANFFDFWLYKFDKHLP